jgi:ureidoglycolate hydrolase
MVILSLQIRSSENNCPIDGKIHQFVITDPKSLICLENHPFGPFSKQGFLPMIKNSSVL